MELPTACHFCKRCKEYYKDLYDRGVTQEFCDESNLQREDGSPVIDKTLLPYCSEDVSNRIDDFSEEDFADTEEYYHAITILDPVRWAEAEFNWKARWYQAQFLRCSSQFRAIRAGRRIGKTEGMAVYVLWKLWTNANFQILVIAPYQPQVKKLFEMIRLFISQSVSLSGSIKTNRESPYEQITLNNGSTVRGFSSGARTGARSDKIRGQDAHEIIMDEADYLADEDLEVISAILASRPEVGLTVTSTPTGVRQKLHFWCTDKTQRFKEFWFISSESPSWTEKAENHFRATYSEGGYFREFLAEFGTEMVGVFRNKDIESSIKNYTYAECARDSNRRYVMGVDWNKNTGTHIVVMEQRWDARVGAIYRSVDKVIIRRAEFQQHAAVDAIRAIEKKWQVSFIYVDAGYGEVQVEMLWKYDKDHPEQKTNYRKRVVPIQMGGNIEIKHPVTGDDEPKPAKPLLVNLTAAQLEQGRIELPRSEDTQTRIIPEELAVVDIGIVQQMREFKVTKYSPQGRPTYSQDFEHTLTAVMLAIGGFLLNFSDLRQVKYNPQIRSTNHPGGGPKPKETKVSGDDIVRKAEQLQPRDRTGALDGSDKIDYSYETIKDELNLLNTGKATPRMVRKNKNRVLNRHRRGGQRRSSF
jgi:replicative DNA helicase